MGSHELGKTFGCQSVRSQGVVVSVQFVLERLSQRHLVKPGAVPKPMYLGVGLLTYRTELGERCFELPLPHISAMHMLVEEDTTVQLRCQGRDSMPAPSCKWYCVVGLSPGSACRLSVLVATRSVFCEGGFVLSICEPAQVRLSCGPVA